MLRKGKTCLHHHRAYRVVLTPHGDKGFAGDKVQGAREIPESGFPSRLGGWSQGRCREDVLFKVRPNVAEPERKVPWAVGTALVKGGGMAPWKE